MSYASAKTAAELFTVPRTVNQDFTNLLSMPFYPVTDAPNEFVRSLFTTAFHVVYGVYNPLPYGPGNNIVFRFSREYNALFMGGFTQSTTRVDLGQPVSTSSDSATWTDGANGNVTVRLMPDTVSNNGMTSHVYNVNVTRNGDVVYNYYLTPVSF